MQVLIFLMYLNKDVDYNSLVNNCPKEYQDAPFSDFLIQTILTTQE